MDIDLIFKIAAVGIIVSILNQVLVRSGREEQATMTSLAALVVVLALRGGGDVSKETLYEEPPLTVTQTSAETSAPVEETLSTVCFYQDGEGYLIPVTRQIPKQDGIAKATLALMVKSSQNDMDAARMGLRTIIPEGTSFDIDISGGKARVDMSKEALNCQHGRGAADGAGHRGGAVLLRYRERGGVPFRRSEAQ